MKRSSTNDEDTGRAKVAKRDMKSNAKEAIQSILNMLPSSKDKVDLISDLYREIVGGSSTENVPPPTTGTRKPPPTTRKSASPPNSKATNQSPKPKSGKKSVNVGRTTSHGLDKTLQKQLLKDVEANGGAKHVTTCLTAFCDTQASLDAERRALYGEAPRCKERYRVENKIRMWRLFTEQENEDLCRHFGVVPFKFQENAVLFTGMTATRKRKKQQATKANATTNKTTGVDVPDDEN